MLLQMYRVNSQSFIKWQKNAWHSFILKWSSLKYCRLERQLWGPLQPHEATLRQRQIQTALEWQESFSSGSSLSSPAFCTGMYFSSFCVDRTYRGHTPAYTEVLVQHRTASVNINRATSQQQNNLVFCDCVLLYVAKVLWPNKLFSMTLQKVQK